MEIEFKGMYLTVELLSNELDDLQFSLYDENDDLIEDPEMYEYVEVNHWEDLEEFWLDKQIMQMESFLD